MPTSDEHTEFCNRVKARRKELGLTQVDMAARMKISQPAYNAIELGRSDPTLGQILKVSKALETSPHDLIPVKEKSL